MRCVSFKIFVEFIIKMVDVLYLTLCGTTDEPKFIIQHADISFLLPAHFGKSLT